MKIVLNKCYGGFGISNEFGVDVLGLKLEDTGYFKYLSGIKDEEIRVDPRVIKAIEEGQNIDGPHAHLEVVEIPDGAHYVIDEYDGIETLYWSETEIHTI